MDYTQYPFPIGPDKEEQFLSIGLDYYKPTMSQLAFEKNKDAEVVFTFKNRSKEILTDYVDIEELQKRLDIRQSGWNDEELEYLGSLTNSKGGERFSQEYLDYLATSSLPPVEVGVGETGDLAITAKGDWALVTFWETVVMSEVNELYFETKVAKEGLDIFDLYNEGNRRLTEKIEVLQSRPDIKFADFGTRRRFSYKWQKHVVERLIDECPENFIGTSNVYLAKKYGITPIGTFAHEMPMVYAGLKDAEGVNPLEGHNLMLRDWRDVYEDDLSVALTDTFGSEFFFADFTPEQAEQWKALRHDSGDPVKFGNRVIEFYTDLGIDPMEKSIVFSDGLDLDTIVMLADTFKDKINVTFGWGTTLTNDLGIKALNIVMKATSVNGESTVKLSDDPGKETGPEEKVELYTDNVIEFRKKRAATITGKQAVSAA